MSKLRASVSEISKNRRIVGVVREYIGGLATVEIGGRIYKGLPVTGGSVAAGQTVLVDFASQRPVVYAQPGNTSGAATTVRERAVIYSPSAPALTSGDGLILAGNGIQIEGDTLSVRTGLGLTFAGNGALQIDPAATLTWTGQHSFAPAADQAPFILGAHAQGQTVLGFKADQLSKSVFAGSGLTGGGALTADQTLHVGAGNGISVSDDAVAVDTTYAFTWSALHTFSAGLTVAAAQSLNFGADVSLTRKGANVLQLAAGDALQSASFTAGLIGWGINADGTAEFSNVRVRGELAASVFKVSQITATAGTQIVAKSASTLSADLVIPASGPFSLVAKNSDAGGSLFAVDDILMLKEWTGAAITANYLTVTAVGANANGSTTYTVTSANGSSGLTYRAGAAIVDWGPANSGFTALSADGSIGPAVNMTIGTHDGQPWDSTHWTIHGRYGNLLDAYGVSGNYYGIGVGDVASGNYLKYDSHGGFVFKAGNNTITFDATGQRIVNSTDWTAPSAIRWMSGIHADSQIRSMRNAENGYLELSNNVRDGTQASGVFISSSSTTLASLYLQNQGPIGHDNAIQMTADASGDYIFLITSNLLVGANPGVAGNRLTVNGIGDVTAKSLATSGDIDATGKVIARSGLTLVDGISWASLLSALYTHRYLNGVVKEDGVAGHEAIVRLQSNSSDGSKYTYLDVYRGWGVVVNNVGGGGANLMAYGQIFEGGTAAGDRVYSPHNPAPQINAPQNGGTSMVDSTLSTWGGTLTRAAGTYTFHLADAGVPDTAKAIYVVIQGSFASPAVGNYIAGVYYGTTTSAVKAQSLVNGYPAIGSGLIPITSNGYFQVIVAGAQITNAVCRVHAYWT